MQMIIGVMGPGEQATERDRQLAFDLGAAIARSGWVLLTGGRNVGVMQAASRGAQQQGGLTVGILPDDDLAAVSEFVEIAIVTGLGNARNAINVLSSAVIVACGMGAGTASEVALALKANKPVILLNATLEAQAFFRQMAPDRVGVAADVVEAIEQIQRFLTVAKV